MCLPKLKIAPEPLENPAGSVVLLKDRLRHPFNYFVHEIHVISSAANFLENSGYTSDFSNIQYFVDAEFAGIYKEAHQPWSGLQAALRKDSLP